MAADVGQGGDWETIKQRALAAGAVEAVVRRRAGGVRQRLRGARPCKANAKYEGKYPLISSLSRPVIVKHLVAAARQLRRRRRRPRLHRQGQRPGPLRGVDRAPWRPTSRSIAPGARAGA